MHSWIGGQVMTPSCRFALRIRRGFIRRSSVYDRQSALKKRLVEVPALLLCGCLACAQPPRIAILQSGEGGFYAEAANRFQQELQKQGVQAQTLSFVLKGDRNDAELPRRLLERKPKVIVAIGTNAAMLLKAHYERLPPDQQVPVVFAMVLDPIKQGLIESAERSGTRFAGVALAVRPLRQFQALRDAVPAAQRVGVIYNPDDAVSAQLATLARDDAQRLGLTLVEAHAPEAKLLGAALAGLQGKVDALWLIPDPVCAAPEPFQQILEWAMAQKVVVLAFAEPFVRRGALLGVGVDLAEQGALAAEQVQRILQGEPPEELPLLTPRRVLTYYNLKAARAIGVAIPDTLLNLANGVFER